MSLSPPEPAKRSLLRKASGAGAVTPGYALYTIGEVSHKKHRMLDSRGVEILNLAVWIFRCFFVTASLSFVVASFIFRSQHILCWESKGEAKSSLPKINDDSPRRHCS